MRHWFGQRSLGGRREQCPGSVGIGRPARRPWERCCQSHNCLCLKVGEADHFFASIQAPSVIHGKRARRARPNSSDKVLRMSRAVTLVLTHSSPGPRAALPSPDDQRNEKFRLSWGAKSDASDNSPFATAATMWRSSWSRLVAACG
jgi:hypothetical protein